MKQTVTIKLVNFARGAPRFNPGPDLRALGYRSRMLRHPDGRPFSLDEAKAFVDAIYEGLPQAREQAARKRARKALPAVNAGGYTVARMCEDMFASAKFRAARGDGGIAPKTRDDYRKKLNRLAQLAPDIWAANAAALTPQLVIALHDKIWRATSANNAKAIIATLSAAFYAAWRTGKVPTNPCRNLRLPGKAERVRYGTPAEVEALMAAADAIEPQIGDAIMIALHTFQRQGDVLALCEDQRTGNGARIRFTQSKTGKVVEPRSSQQLLARLADATARKRALGFGASPQIVIDPRHGGPYSADWLRKRFRAIREQAAIACPSVADFTFQDLRDTAVTRAALAGWTLMEICAHSGHSPGSVQMILKSYVQLMHAIADAGSDKLESWMQAQGIAV